VPQDPVLIMAEVVVTLAFFMLVGYVARALRSSSHPAAAIAAIATLVGALPAILYALYAWH